MELLWVLVVYFGPCFLLALSMLWVRNTRVWAIPALILNLVLHYLVLMAAIMAAKTTQDYGWAIEAGMWSPPVLSLLLAAFNWRRKAKG